ncbi:MAG: SDR family NAD(P)-dependent oxidoreductase [Polyangiaceae bacterium]|jgi:3-hydroxybutyrate dehydrogenase
MTTARFLDGRVAIVTGGGKGIGRAIALELSACGAGVLVTGRDERALGETVGEIAHGGGKARHLVGDVREMSHARAAAAVALETWGGLHVVVANAGLAGTLNMGGDSEGNDERLSRARAILDTNLLGTYQTFDAALAVMRGPGRLVAISSVLGKFGASGQAAYCASKAGLHGLVRAVAIEVGPREITCNAVCPGWVDTEMARARIADLAAEEGISYEQRRQAARDDLPLRRFVEPEEVARFVSFLCSPAADAITGQALSICSGTTTFAG